MVEMKQVLEHPCLSIMLGECLSNAYVHTNKRTYVQPLTLSIRPTFRIARRGAERFDLLRIETSPAGASRTANLEANHGV